MQSNGLVCIARFKKYNAYRLEAIRAWISFMRALSVIVHGRSGESIYVKATDIRYGLPACLFCYSFFCVPKSGHLSGTELF